MQIVPLDFVADNSLTGFRLQRLEVLNWGTFHQHVWHIQPDGNNALLTGDIGSGKSTLVDAITTLLVPHHRIVYNKAAGAESKERNLASYIRGEYKNEKDDLTQTAKAIALRDENNYTVLLGYFYNKGFDQGITLAQVFWLKEQKRPERFFIVAEQPLTIVEHMTDFGSNILDLKKRLRKSNNIDVFDSFKEYSNRFRHLFGIKNEQALDLFYQTVSMKSVGNLTEFVRQHMLEKSDVEIRIEELRRSFDNLNRAHEAVLKAKRQVSLLMPLVQDGERYQSLIDIIDDLRYCREALISYFSQHKTALLEEKISQLEIELQKIEHRLRSLKNNIDSLRQHENDLTRNIQKQGGHRIQELEQQIILLAVERNRKVKNNEEYSEHIDQIGLSKVVDENNFYNNLAECKNLLEQLQEFIENEKLAHDEKTIALNKITEQHNELESELTSLRQRKTNIPDKNLLLRHRMLETLNLQESDLPFAGELLQVQEQEHDWEGAIERVLHNFGLSLLVPEQHYARVHQYVDRTHLRGRLVYFRLREKQNKRVFSDLSSTSLVNKLTIKHDTEFHDWLEKELIQRFDYACCNNLDEFRRQSFAITRQGQIKAGPQRHEKDDRRDLQDRSHYVLGWSNENKIRALEKYKTTLEKQAQQLGQALADIQQHQNQLQDRRDHLRDVLKIDDYAHIHWQPVAKNIQQLEEEKTQIENSSDKLQSLREQLKKTETERENKQEKVDKLVNEKGKLQQQHEDSQEQLQDAQNLLTSLTEQEQLIYFPKLQAYQQQALPGIVLTLKNIEKGQRELQGFLQKQIESNDGKIKRLAERIIGQMKDYKSEFSAETTEVDASLAAIAEYEAMQKKLKSEDLPQHESKFKQLLNEGTINGIAMFQSQLENEKQEIENKINTINTSLREIEYDKGTYIILVMDKTQDADIRNFQQDLRQCLAHSLDDDALYDESKFARVKAIIDRFNGRKELVDIDRKWTRNVTDVRNWFNFSASERWQEDDTEKEYYSDSSGKSGGQKEKLAYTVLASALAYQFGLEWGAIKSRSFRFVVIDEAFGRGSDESTRYGLELFKKLNLQLLIVTPLQKINIIEDYINAVHFVYNENGNNSIVKNLTLQEYQTEKQKYLHNSTQ